MASFTIAVDNPSDAPVTVGFSSGQRYDVVAFAGEQEVWRWLDGRDFTDAESELTVPPGVALLDRLTWDWRDARGVPLPPGTYCVVATLTTAPPRTGNVLEIRLRPAREPQPQAPLAEVGTGLGLGLGPAYTSG